jgi:hypothetical protein
LIWSSLTVIINWNKGLTGVGSFAIIYALTKQMEHNMKLSKANLKTARDLLKSAHHFSLIIARRNANCEFLPEWFKEKPIAWYEGAMALTYASLDTLLMNNKSYHGYTIRTVTDKQFGIEHVIHHYGFDTESVFKHSTMSQRAISTDLKNQDCITKQRLANDQQVMSKMTLPK